MNDMPDLGRRQGDSLIRLENSSSLIRFMRVSSFKWR
jgi:hypothetical protein